MGVNLSMQPTPVPLMKMNLGPIQDVCGARLHNNTATGSHFDVPQEDNFVEDLRIKTGRQNPQKHRQWTSQRQRSSTNQAITKHKLAMPHDLSCRPVVLANDSGRVWSVPAQCSAQQRGQRTRTADGQKQPVTGQGHHSGLC